MSSSKGFRARSKMRIQNNIIYGPPGEKIPNISIGQHIFSNLRNDPYRILQVDVESGKCYTCKNVLNVSIKIASILKVYGVNIGDRVSIISENHPNYIPTICGTAFVGAVSAPLNPVYTEREYKHMLEILQPRVAFVSQQTEKILAKIASKLNWTMKLIELDDRALTRDVPTLEELFRKHANAVDQDKFVPTSIADAGTQIAAILGSSGTTGFPKGVSLSHKNFLAFILNFSKSDYMDFRQNHRMLLFLPLFHGFAFGSVLLAINTGLAIYIMRKFDIKTMVRVVDDYKITYLPMPPPVLVALAKYPNLDEHDFSNVIHVVCGAAPFPKEAADKVRKIMNLSTIRNGYGMTESSIVTNVSDKRQLGNDGSVGILGPGLVCKVVDQNTGDALGPEQVGEVCFKGDQVMLGYFKNPQATAEIIDKENWLHSGDLGYYNKNGDLYVTGRIKELIKYKGYQVSPSEIEMIVQTYPHVKEAAVIGKPDENSGEVPMAFVVKEPGSDVTAKEIVDYANGNLSRQKWLRGGVQFIKTLPRTASGKILRRELHALLPKL